MINVSSHHCVFRHVWQQAVENYAIQGFAVLRRIPAGSFNRNFQCFFAFFASVHIPKLDNSRGEIIQWPNAVRCVRWQFSKHNFIQYIVYTKASEVSMYVLLHCVQI